MSAYGGKQGSDTAGSSQGALGLRVGQTDPQPRAGPHFQVSEMELTASYVGHGEDAVRQGGCVASLVIFNLEQSLSLFFLNNINTFKESRLVIL